MNYSEISIRVGLNDDKIPADIKWKASDSEVSQLSDAKAFGLNIWDPIASQSLNLTLWTEDMQTDEMHSFFFQSLLQQADHYVKATGNPFAKEEILKFVQELSKRTSDWENTK